MKRTGSAKSNGKKVKHEPDENTGKKKVESSSYFEKCDGVFEKFLGNDISLKDFMENYWEKKPLIIRRSDNEEWLNFIKNLFSYELLKNIVKDKTPIYELDVNLCKLVNGKKKVFNKNGVVKLDHLEKSFNNDKTTIQFHQPQRFSDEIWNLLEKFECYFQCLVGSNIYITPSDSQGLASHYDDIEAFVIQLEGSKHWLLYDSVIELPNTYSNDLDANKLKEPMHDIVLQTGDILYFPRGIIHQANTPVNETNSFSTHITISTYQNFNKMEYVSSVIESAVRNSFDTNIELRRGLPVGFFRQDYFGEIVKSTLEKINLDQNSCMPRDLLEDFMSSRLPPYNCENSFSISTLGLVQKNDKNMKFRLKYPDHVYTILSSSDDDDDESKSEEEEENDDQKKEVYANVYYSIKNIREEHMMTKEGNRPNCLKLKAEYYEFLKFFINKEKNNWISILEMENKLKNVFPTSIFNDVMIPLAVENLIEIEK